MLQHKGTYTDQDVRFGMNLPYIEYCGQGCSWYGHILSFLLARASIRVHMDEEAARHMNNDGVLEVRFTVTDAEFEELRSALHETFLHYGHFSDGA